MPRLNRSNADLYYEVCGEGEAVIALHGLSENGEYWSQSGVAKTLSEHYQFVSLDMRGHGRSRVTGRPEGFDIETLADDVDALAEAVAERRFHLLGHATGGMVAARYASRANDRLLSLVLAGTSSATGVVSPAKVEGMASVFRGKDWETLIKEMRLDPGPFLFRLDHADNSEALWEAAERIFRLNDPDTLATFIGQFYDDPDPRAAALKAIRCPTLVVTGEHDKLMRPSCELLAGEIPKARLVVLPGVGHMTALEAPDAFSRTLLDFFNATQRSA